MTPAIFARYSNVPVLAICLTLFACTETSDTIEPTLTSLWENEFSSCAVNCHSPEASDGTDNGPDLRTKSSFYTNLVRKNVNNDFPLWAGFKTGNCNDINFIAPGNAGRSTVVTSLIESYSVAQTECVSSFNLHEVTRTTITSKETREALVNWINDGAPNN